MRYERVFTLRVVSEDKPGDPIEEAKNIADSYMDGIGMPPNVEASAKLVCVKNLDDVEG